MKWLRKVLSRGEVDVDVGSIRLELSQVRGWLKDREEQIDLREVEGIYSRIAKVALDLEADLGSLKSATPGEAVPPRLLRAGLAGREAEVKQIEVLSGRLGPPDTLSIDSAATYYTDLVRQMERIGSKIRRAHRYAAALFPHEIEAISSDHSSLGRLLIELGEAIQEKQRERALCLEAGELASRALDGRARIEQMLREIEKERIKLEEMRQRERQLEEDALSANSMEPLKTSLEAKRCQLREVEMEVAKMVAPLSKALSRALKQNAREGLNLKHGETLEILSRSPHRALCYDLGPPLKELRSSLASLGLKEKMRDKVQESIDRILVEEAFWDLKARWLSTEREVLALERSLEERTRTGPDEELARLRDSRARLEEKFGEDAGLLRSLEEEAKENGTALQKMVEKIAGKPVLIES